MPSLSNLLTQALLAEQAWRLAFYRLEQERVSWEERTTRLNKRWETNKVGQVGREVRAAMWAEREVLGMRAKEDALAKATAALKAALVEFSNEEFRLNQPPVNVEKLGERLPLLRDLPHWAR